MVKSPEVGPGAPPRQAKKLESIVIATSLLPESQAITRSGLAVARAAGARAAIVHGVMIPAWYGEAPLPHMGDQGRVLRANVDALRQAIADVARGTGLPGDELAGCFLEHAPPHRAVIDVAHRLKADLIVVGASDRPGGRLPSLGSTAARVVQKATRPVLVVRPGFTVPPKRVLAPVDLSALSGDALRCGLERVQAFCGDAEPEIEAVFALSPLERDGWPHFTGEQVERFARQELERFVQRHAGAMAPRVGFAVRVGEAQGAIAAEADAWGADLIVVGTHGRSGFERFVLGSVASDVVRESKASVLVVPPEAAARAALGAVEVAVPEGVPAGADWEWVSDEIPVGAGSKDS